MKDMVVKVYKISEDGYPDINRVENDIPYICTLGFASNGVLYSGYPETSDGVFTGNWVEDTRNDLIEDVTHWVEFPGIVHELFPGKTLWDELL